VSASRSSEQHFQTQVEQMASFYGWRFYHAPDNRPSKNTGRVQRVTAGFLDLVLLRAPELIFAELKTETGRVRDAQKTWMSELARVPGIEVYLWRPSDFDEINERLSRGRHRTEPLYLAGEPAA
jgi:hypothetical protein